MAGPNWKLEDDYKTVTVTFPTDPPVVLQLDVAAIEDMLLTLGELRALMKPEIAKAFAVGQKVDAVPNPNWLTEPELMKDDSLFHIRDPRYGWLHYLFPRAEAMKLGQLLQKQAELPPQTTPPSKTN
jgi:hypothetical protein